MATGCLGFEWHGRGPSVREGAAFLHRPAPDANRPIRATRWRSGEKSTPRHQAQADRQRRSPTKPRKPPNAAIIVPVTWRQSGDTKKTGAAKKTGATKKKCRLETTVIEGEFGDIADDFGRAPQAPCPVQYPRETPQEGRLGIAPGFWPEPLPPAAIRIAISAARLCDS